ncbi:MAG: type IV secretion system DNA-binding domain-containing protein, partial [Methanosarcina sp.]|nr:type IV secretion system DNA-binding domain-containing protein [Methanosarcina sp.]
MIYPDEEEKERAIRAFRNLEPDFFSHPQEFGRWRFLFDAAEASTAFRLPLAINDNLVGLKVVNVKPLPLPKEVKELAKFSTGKTKIGLHSWSASSVPVYISDEDRLRHVYTVGQTGTGKTTLLKNMILEDLKKEAGVIVMDPHGDLFYEICGLIPESRMDDVVVLNPADMEHPVGFNLIEWQTREEKYFLIKEMQEIIKRMLEDEYGEFTAAEITGTLFYHFVEMVLLLLMSHPEKKATIYDFYEFFQSDDKKKEWAVDPDRYDDPTLRSWVKNMLPELNFLKRGEDNNISIGEFISGKFKEFIFDPKLRAIFAQQKSTINISEIMNHGKVLLVNLAKGELSARGSRFLGMVLMSRIMISAMERIKTPKEKRKPVYVYVDEFQNIATSSFSTLISEARKFGVGLVLANQFLAQIKRRNIYESILGNVATWVAFRVGLADATLLEDVFLPTVNSSNLVNLPNWQAAVKTSIKGRGVLPFYIKTEKSLDPDDQVKNKVIELSRSKYSINNKNSMQAESLAKEKMTLSEAIKLKREEEERRLDELKRIEQEVMEKLEALKKRKQDN